MSPLVTTFLLAFVGPARLQYSANFLDNEPSASGDGESGESGSGHKGGCVQNNEFHPIGDEWNLIIPPFDLIPCLRCICLPGSDGETSGVMECSDVENQCPELTCQFQYKLDGLCCPFCADEGFSGDGVERVYETPKQHLFLGTFMSLLTGSQFNRAVPTFGSGWARFFVTGDTVHYFIDLAGISRIIGIEIRTKAEETLLSVPPHLLANKVCGVWNRAGSDVIETFTSEDSELRVVVKSEAFPDGEVTGDVFYKLNEWIETFISLLKPALPGHPHGHRAAAGAGGLAMLKLRHDKASVRFVVAVDVDGVIEDAVFFLPQPEHPGHAILYRFIETYNPAVGWFEGTWYGMNATELKWLAHGLIHVSVSFRKDGGRGHIHGAIAVPSACSGLSAVLSGNQKPLRVFSGAGASGLFELRRDGSLRFDVKWFGLEGRLTSIGFYTPVSRIYSGFNNRLQLVQNITDTAEGNEAHGTWQDLSVDVIDTLAEGNLQVMVCSDQYERGEITGQIQWLLFNSDEKINTELSMTLTGSQSVPFRPSGAAAQVWFSLDESCSLHFRLAVRGLGLDDRVVAASMRGPAKPGTKGPELYVISSSFSRNLAIGVIRHPDKDLYNALNQGLLYIEIVTEETTLRSQLQLTTNCVESTYKEVTFDYCRGCAIRDLKYANGANWNPTCAECADGEIDYATRCYCQCGKVICWPIDLTCPQQICSNGDKPVFPQGGGWCCRTCPRAREGEECTADKQLQLINHKAFQLNEVCRHDDRAYPRGFVFQPVTRGKYVKCENCLCQLNGSISCHRRQCPMTLECLGGSKTAEGDCCPSCEGDSTTEPAPTPKQTECIFDGTAYKNGEEFHPYVPGFGYLWCAKATCVNGSLIWRVIDCPKLDCDDQIWPSNECCPHCSGGEEPGGKGSGATSPDAHEDN
eukprot:m.95558 g.95558  ORF g.95558 m.95558 type:complete len:919 (+) comp36854_c0_seq4:106-2862(+)